MMHCASLSMVAAILAPLWPSFAYEVKRQQRGRRVDLKIQRFHSPFWHVLVYQDAKMTAIRC